MSIKFSGLALVQHQCVIGNERRMVGVAAAGLALVFIVVLASAAIRLGQAATPPLDGGALSALRAVHRSAALLEALAVLWLGWFAWRERNQRPSLALAAALAIALTLALSGIGIVAGRSPPHVAAAANLLGGLALAAVFARALRLLRQPAERASAFAAGIGAVLVAVQCMLGARLSVFPAAASSPALPAHAMLGVVLVGGAVWFALCSDSPRRRTAGLALAIVAPAAGFTALHHESSAAAAFAHAAAVALFVVAAAYTRLRPA